MVIVRYLVIVIFTQLFVLSAFARPPAELSYEEFKKLAEEFAPKVDVFSAVWEKDSEALIYAGSSRDYLYWLLGEFRGLNDRPQVEAKIKQLRSLPIINFRHISSPESDVDIFSSSQEVRKLFPQEFAIRKFDIEPPHRLNLATEEGRSEVNQGFVSLEKIVLGKDGFRSLPQFKDGVREIFEGNISIDFSKPEKFWQTKYAQSGENHPILLAARYLRAVIQDYAKRYGTKDYPDLQKLMAPMDPNVIKHIKKIIADAASGQDQKFEKFIESYRGISWLNGSLQKSFRSFSHPTAAYMMMKEMGVIDLIAAYRDTIQSLNGYLLQQQRDETQIDANFKKFKVNPKDIYVPISTFFPDFKLYHGPGSDENFRAIIYQGFIPSEDGLAGSGVYGVFADNIEFAIRWKKSGNNVIALTLSPFTKLVDITQGPGKKLFENWKSKNHNNISEDQFAKDFGIDIIKYPYEKTEAFVLKNGSIVEKTEGVFKQPLSLAEIIDKAKAMNVKFNVDIKSTSSEEFFRLQLDMIFFLQDFWRTPLNTQERKQVVKHAPNFFARSLQDPFFVELKKELGTSIADHVVLLLNQDFTQELAWKTIPLLMQDPDRNVRRFIAYALHSHSTWPQEVWAQFPTFMKDTDIKASRIIVEALVKQTTWPQEVLAEIPNFMKDLDFISSGDITKALGSQSTWPPQVWEAVLKRLKDPNENVRSDAIQALLTRTSSSEHIVKKILSLQGSEFEKLKKHYRTIDVIKSPSLLEQCKSFFMHHFGKILIGRKAS